ncbi:hypothetical protein BZG36_02426 [Bifiguratus adelaidae]|uniref:Aminotransferase class I/classII large domain-containing protein n=1 Tax=Bifiguratus adelaidae TaxID=1938954 RepID=A0A261Y3P4_9FUNG|nr:hypothetical protein BZG36_02426 [Bifiguratus adelaidae]
MALKSLFDEFIPPNTIHLGIGAPSSDLLPVSLMREAAASCLTESNPSAFSSLQYGPELGDGDMLERLATFLAAEYGTPVDRQVDRQSCIALTSGASQSLANIASIFCHPSTTRHVLFQNPTYHHVFRTLRDAGYREDQFVGVPDDEEGMDIEGLRTWLEQQATIPTSNGHHPHRNTYLLYCVPTFANPDTTTLSHTRRQQLVQLAREYDILIVCDDVYDMLWYDASATVPPRLASYDEEGDERAVVISNGTFSKILGPGVRCGWMEARRSIIARVKKSGVYVSGGSPAHFVSLVLHHLLIPRDGKAMPLSKHLLHLRMSLSERLQALATAVQTDLVPLGCALYPNGKKPTGGYFVWIQLPPNVTTAMLSRELLVSINRGQGVKLMLSDVFWTPGTAPPGHFVRLCFAYYNAKDLVEGVQRLKNCIERCL